MTATNLLEKIPSKKKLIRSI